MTQKIKISTNYSLARAILDILLDIGENSLVPMSPKLLWRKALGYPQPKRWRLNQALRYLENLGKIKLQLNKKNQLFAKLTRKGKIHSLLQRIRHDYKKPREWDGKWRIIIWDIPESSRKQRNQIRYFLKNLGFFRLQQSVFITPFSLSKEAVQFLRESGLLGFIRFLRVDKLDDDKSLRQHFGL